MQFCLSHEYINTDKPTQIQTPTKKYKKQHNTQPKTADSIELTDKKTTSLNQIDPEQLFERFHQIMTISQIQNQDSQEDDEENLYRKLNYEDSPNNTKKLEFSPDFSSMRKKNKPQNGKCFSANAPGKQLFKVMEINSPKKTKCSKFEESSDKLDQQTITSTPPKSQKENKFWQMTAKKQSPYRQLIRKE